MSGGTLPAVSGSGWAFPGPGTVAAWDDALLAGSAGAGRSRVQGARKMVDGRGVGPATILRADLDAAGPVTVALAVRRGLSWSAAGAVRRRSTVRRAAGSRLAGTARGPRREAAPAAVGGGAPVPLAARCATRRERGGRG